VSILYGECKCGSYEVGSGSPVHLDSCKYSSKRQVSNNPGYIYDQVKDARPSWESIYIRFAHSLAERSSCDRASVGSVITSWDHSRVLAIGYNGNYRGGPNCCDTDEAGSCGCLHAEENAIIKLDFNDHSDKRLYTTTSPCLMCAKRIINAGVVEVIFANLYRKREGIELLQNNGIKVLCAL